MGLFKVEGELLTIDKEYIRGIPAFRRILERDKGSEGDSQGAKKYRAYKEFFFIYIYKDLRAFPSMGGMNEKESFRYAIVESQLPDDFKIDSDLKLAIDKYVEIQNIEQVTLNAINTLLRGIKLQDTIAKGIIDNIETQLELSEKAKITRGSTNEPANIIAEMATTKTLLEQLDMVTNISTSLPKTVATLESLQEKLKKEQIGTTTGRGNMEIGNRADPKGKK